MQILASIYPIAGAFCVLLAVLHFLIWLRNRADTAFLLAAVMAAAAGVSAFVELRLLTTVSIPDYQVLSVNTERFIDDGDGNVRALAIHEVEMIDGTFTKVEGTACGNAL